MNPRRSEHALDKSQLSEIDICDKYITPSLIKAGWRGMDQIYREFPLRAGRVVVRGSKAQRDKATVLRADYALFYKADIPLATIEAKDINLLRNRNPWRAPHSRTSARRDSTHRQLHRTDSRPLRRPTRLAEALMEV